MKIELKANEVVVRATDTFHCSGSSETKGKLIITNQRIYFKSLENEQALPDFELLPKEIKDILFYNILKFIPRGLDVITIDGRQFRFKVKNRNEWCRHIASMC
ncbi:MAG: hypothetical protein H6541_02395 [Lentimicrobiaceae bacterium]|nr:hypothetical protein [Lentimicrobiaceae bacterium]MCB9023500.1 hypothetical protein [Lentimicrobiaceae bacterium]MCO5267011.1 hypothetical protein [Lentimicrobium sp.]